MQSSEQMQREAAPVTVAGIELHPLTLPRVNAASAMKCAVFNLDAEQRTELAEKMTYRGIIRDIIIVFYLCSSGREASDEALWSPSVAFTKASAFAETHNISETSPDFPEMQAAMWALINPIFKNEAIPVGDNELSRPKKKPVVM